jgi:hypothetical protein
VRPRRLETGERRAGRRFGSARRHFVLRAKLEAPARAALVGAERLRRALGGARPRLGRFGAGDAAGEVQPVVVADVGEGRIVAGVGEQVEPAHKALALRRVEVVHRRDIGERAVDRRLVHWLRRRNVRDRRRARGQRCPERQRQQAGAH